MFKGHTDIILTNLETGEKKVYSDDNLVTDALEEYLKPLGNLTKDVRNQDMIASYLNTLLGGVLLFRYSMSEDHTRILVNPDNLMIANGSYGISNSGAVTELGSYNSVESGFIEDEVYRHVWEWGSAQGNGQIRCVCLTSAAHGFIGEGNENSKQYVETVDGKNYTHFTYTQDDSEWYQRCFAENHNGIILRIEDGYAYITDVSEWTSSSIKIRKIIMPTETLDLRVGRDNVVEVDNFTISVQNPPVWFTNKTFRGYGMGVSAHDNGTIITLAMGLDSDWSCSEKYVYGIVFDENWDVSFGNIDLSTSSDEVYAHFGVNGKIGILQATTGRLYDITTGQYTTINYDGITAFNDSHSGYGDRPVFMTPQGVVYFIDHVRYDPTKNKVMFVNAIEGVSGCAVNPLDAPLSSVISKNDLNNCRDFRAERFNGYIATINNLQTPIDKDSLHSMKLVYTMRFSDE